ncbi:hypothetical protein MSAN_02013600 [Mycena sanguinolenta]|uniref:Uncharacterized protein n=1 Tax=Mycena sanguinolenta TaxID=230812 RepID=A0A8H6XLA6_9AGAR|nr:hypothetical protein MSAN_02013600 [Mycena sanguinolenta]
MLRPVINFLRDPPLPSPAVHHRRKAFAPRILVVNRLLGFQHFSCLVSKPVLVVRNGGAQRPVPQKLARTAASVRAEAMVNAGSGGSVSAPPIVKREPVPVQIPPPASTGAKKAASASPQRTWRHPDELQYIRSAGKTWNDLAIVRFLVANAFGIPRRSTNGSNPWVNVRYADGSDVVLPRAYRLPLLWVAKYLWTSVKLVLTAEPSIRSREWDSTKFEILHIARLCAGLLSSARAQLDADVMERGWRCAQFDRALHRYWHEWLISRDEFVRDFFREFGEDEYKVDVLKFTWSRWVRKSHKGFALTKEESANGISAAEFMRGLVVREDGTFEWREDEARQDPPQIQADAVDAAPPAPTPPAPTPPAPTPAPISTHENEIIVPSTVPEVPSYPRLDIHVPQTIAPTPSRVSFRVRPLNPFLRSQAEVDVAGADSPADVSMKDGRAAEGLVNATAKNRPNTAPGDKVQMFAHSRDRRTPIEQHASESRGAESEEMQVDSPVPEKETSWGAAVVATSVESLRPGSNAVPSGPVPEPVTNLVEEEGEEEEDDEEEMPLNVSQQNQNPAPGIKSGIEDPNPELDGDEEDDDLELLYPDVDQHEGDTSSISQTAPNGTLSASNSTSSSRSVSPIPPLSTARFPPPDASTSPHPDSESGIVTRFLQSCERLGEDMRALRAEVAQLRAGAARNTHTPTPTTELEARVRRLEEERPPFRGHASCDENTNAGGAGRRWSHPLQHLLSLDSEMDVDEEGEGVVGDGAGRVTSTYSTAPLPPRSRKFDNTLRL